MTMNGDVAKREGGTEMKRGGMIVTKDWRSEQPLEKNNSIHA